VRRSRKYPLRFASLSICLFAVIALYTVTGCHDRESISDPTQAVHSPQPRAPQAKIVAILAPLVDPAKLDTLKGERAANPRLRKICYWLETARRSGLDPSNVIGEAHRMNGVQETTRERIQREALLRNLVILERLGCLDVAGMDKLRRGNAPTITLGPYASELATVDHILPRSVVPELDNALYNLELMPATLNGKKSNKIGDRQRQLAKQWHAVGLLTETGLRSVMTW